MFTPDPVEPFFRHTKRNYDVDLLAVRRIVSTTISAFDLSRKRRFNDVPAWSVINQIGDFQNLPIWPADQIKSGLRIATFMDTQEVENLSDFVVFVVECLGRPPMRNVDDRLLVRVQHPWQSVDVIALVEFVVDPECLEKFVAFQLLVVAVGDLGEPILILWPQHWIRIPAEIAAGHCHHMAFRSGNQTAQDHAQPVVVGGRDMVEFVNGDEAIVKSLDTRSSCHLIETEAECGMGADQHLGIAFQERLKCLDLLLVCVLARQTEVPAIIDVPVRLKPVAGQIRRAE